MPDALSTASWASFIVSKRFSITQLHGITLAQGLATASFTSSISSTEGLKYSISLYLRSVFQKASIATFFALSSLSASTIFSKPSNCLYPKDPSEYTSNPQPIGFSGILLAKRQNSFYCTYFLHNRNVADTKSPYPIKRLEVIRWFNQKSMVFNQSLS